MAKNKKFKIDFSNGEFAEHVTGAGVYLPDFEALIECGFSQSNSLKRDYTENKQKFNFSCKKLKYVLVGHNHLDHTGRLPLLYKRGCNATIYVTQGSAAIIKNMLEDSVKINERDARLLSHQTGKEYEPIYNIDDVSNCLAHIQEVPMHEVFQLDENIAIKFVPSGHIRYAAQIEI